MLGGREAEAGSVSGRAAPVNGGGSGRVCGGRPVVGPRLGPRGRRLAEDSSADVGAEPRARVSGFAKSVNLLSRTFLAPPSLSFRSCSRSQIPVSDRASAATCISISAGLSARPREEGRSL